MGAVTLGDPQALILPVLSASVYACISPEQGELESVLFPGVQTLFFQPTEPAEARNGIKLAFCSIVD
jgi:hypothetical protein